MKARAEGASTRDFAISLGLALSFLLPFVLFTQRGLFTIACIAIVSASAYAAVVTALTFRGQTNEKSDLIGATS